MVLDEKMQPVEEPDLTRGEIVPSVAQIEALWVADSPEVVELRVVREYEGGGADVEEVVVQPAEGHWEAPEWALGWLAANGDPNDRLHIVPCDVYREFTPREICAVERADDHQRQLNEVPERARAEIEELQSCAASMDALACALYEELAAKDDEIASTDAAICSLYELAIGEGV